MNISAKWKEKMLFDVGDGNHLIQMDTGAPLGDGSALTPKQLVAAGLVGCTAMDVIALMKKMRQPVESFEVETEIEKSDSGHPQVFTRAMITFHFKGEIEAEKAIQAVTLSQTKYCGVSAMLSKAFPIHYRIVLNEKLLATEGIAFPAEQKPEL